MYCRLCHRPAPAELEMAIDEGWIPSYYSGHSEIPGPVCPQCCQKYLRIDKEGDWETIAPPADAYRWN